MSEIFDERELELLKDTLSEILEDADNDEVHAPYLIDNVYYFFKRLEAKSSIESINQLENCIITQLQRANAASDKIKDEKIQQLQAENEELKLKLKSIPKSPWRE